MGEERLGVDQWRRGVEERQGVEERHRGGLGGEW